MILGSCSRMQTPFLQTPLPSACLLACLLFVQFHFLGLSWALFKVPCTVSRTALSSPSAEPVPPLVSLPLDPHSGPTSYLSSHCMLPSDPLPWLQPRPLPLDPQPLSPLSSSAGSIHLDFN